MLKKCIHTIFSIGNNQHFHDFHVNYNRMHKVHEIQFLEMFLGQKNIIVSLQDFSFIWINRCISTNSLSGTFSTYCNR
jgi:hypothetical protein